MLIVSKIKANKDFKTIMENKTPARQKLRMSKKLIVR